MQLDVGGSKLYEIETANRLGNAISSGTRVLGRESGEFLTEEKLTALIGERRERAAIAEKIEGDAVNRAARWYAARNLLLFLGFFLILASKVWQGYQ